MSEIAFFKMTGSGNDFVMLDGRSTTVREWTPDRVAMLCDRRGGVGADGLVVLTPEDSDAVRMTYWNSDGSRAAMCGNAALCSTRLARHLGMAPTGDLRLLTDAGVVQARCTGEGDTANIRLLDFPAPTEVPGLGTVLGERWIAFATVGVPHLVVRVDDIEAIDLLGRGRSLRFDARLGPEGANVNFISPAARGGDPWAIRTYERGVEDETWACGTGTAAAALALAQRSEETLPARFRSRAGAVLTVTGRIDAGSASDVWLGGQGKLVFSGRWWR